MEIQTQDIKEIASTLLSLLDKENISTTEELTNRMEETFRFGERPLDLILLSNRPSNLRTSALTISYSRRDVGIPLEIKINPSLSYSQIILKAQQLFAGYIPFATDPFENIAQSKIIGSAKLSDSLGELKRLSTL